MAGIDTIVHEILQEAQTKADELMKEAQDQAGSIQQEAAAADEKAAAGIRQEADRTAADLAQRARSQVDLRKRQAILKAKQAVIDGVIEKAYLQLAAQGDEPYFAMILKLVQKNVRAGDGLVCFNSADLKRIPAGFEASLAALASKAGGTLKVSPDPVKIRSGCIVSYGGIEENCSLDALFAEKRETLRDLANSVLW